MLAHAGFTGIEHGNGQIDATLGVLGVELNGFLGGFETGSGLVGEQVEPAQVALPLRA
jgi:hypothetical protein